MSRRQIVKPDIIEDAKIIRSISIGPNADPPEDDEIVIP